MATPPQETRFNEAASSWDSNPSVLRATSLAHQFLLSRLSPSTSSFPSSSSSSSGEAAPAADISTYDVLEIGCGTGLLSLLLAPSVRSITAVDVARGMIDAFKEKLDPGIGGSHSHVKNVLPVFALLEDPDDERIQIDPVTLARNTTTTTTTGDKRGGGRRFDLVTSHLVLHHIRDLAGVLRLMLNVLKPSTGRIMLTDYENFGPEARKFHPESKMDEVERHGIERGEMIRLLEEAGFVDVKVEVAFEMDKPVETAPGSGVMGGSMTFPFLICEGRRP